MLGKLGSWVRRLWSGESPGGARARLLWVALLLVWSFAQLAWGAVKPGLVAAVAAALAVLYLVALKALPEPLKLSKAARGWLVAVGAVFLLQLLPLPFLHPYTTELRRQHGVGIWWPGTADTFLTLRSLAQISAYVLTALLVLRLRNAGLSSPAVLKGVVLVLVLQGFYALAQVAFEWKTLPFGEPRMMSDATGTLVNRNSFAGLMSMGLAAAGGLSFMYIYYNRDRAWSKRIETGLLWGLAAALFALSIVLSKSRGGTLAAVTAVLVIPFLWRGRPSALGVLCLLVIGIMAVMVANPGALVDRFAQIDPWEVTADTRWEFWKAAVVSGLRQPALGFGLGSHPQAIHPFQPVHVAGQVQHAHSEYANALFEGGPLWLLVLLGGLVAWYVRAGSRLRELAGPDRIPLVAAMAAVSAMAVHGLVDFDFRITAVGMLFAVMVGLGASRSAGGAMPMSKTVEGVTPLLALAAAAVVAFVPLRSLSWSPYDYRLAWAKAREAQKRKDAPEADRRFLVAADLFPAHPDVQREAGLWFWEAYEQSGDRGDLLKSGRCLRRLFRQQPAAVAAVLDEVGVQGLPVEDLEALLPDAALPVAHAAAYLARKDRWQEARALFDRLCPATAENAAAFDVFAGGLAQAGQWGLETQVLEKRLQVKSDASAYAAAAVAWKRLGELNRALEHASMAARIDPATSAWHALKGDVLRAQGKRLDATDSYTEAIARSPLELGYRLTRGTIYSELGMHGPASDDYREALRSRPQDRGLVFALARSLVAGGQSASARRVLEDYLSRVADDAEAKRFRDSIR